MAVDTRRARILVVEDDPELGPLMAEALTLKGHEVDMAVSGREALERIAACPYDLIVSDLWMPELDGVGLFRELARRRPTLLRRMGFVTSMMDSPQYQRFLADTAVPVLHKPFDLAGLHGFVQRLL